MKIYINRQTKQDWEYLGIYEVEDENEDDKIKLRNMKTGKILAFTLNHFKKHFRLKDSRGKRSNKNTFKTSDCIIGAKEMTTQEFVAKKLKKGQIKVFTFNDMPIGIYRGKFFENEVHIKTINGLKIFDRKTRMQTNISNKNFASRMEEYDDTEE